MPVLAALTTALPYLSAAWQVRSQYLTKPKKEDYLPTGSMYQRYLAHLKSKTSESTVYHQRMRPALRQIGQQTQRGQRQVGYQVARQKPGGGIEAQMRMGINQQALEAIGIASEKASVAQERVNERTGEQLIRIGIQEEQALQRYQTAKKDWTKRMFMTAGQAGLSLASIAAKNTTARNEIITDAEKTIAKSDEAIRTDYNALPESFRKQNPFNTYLQDVRDRATIITTKLIEPTKDDIDYRKGSLSAARDHRKQFEKGTKEWEIADDRVQSSKEKFKVARSDYSKAKQQYREDADKYETTYKESYGGLAPFAGTTQQISAAYSNLIGERIESKEEFQKDEEAEKTKADSFETLRQLTERLEKAKDPAQAYVMLDEVKDNMILKDKHKALTKIESTFPDLVYDDPVERKIVVAEMTGDRVSAKRNLADVVKTGTIAQIEKAGSAINAIDSRTRENINFQYSQETRQTAKDKKEYDARALESTLNNNVTSTIEYLGIYDKTYSADIVEPQIGRVGETAEPLRKILEKIKRDKTFKELIQTFEGVTFKNGKGMTPEAAKGLKKLAVKYVSLIDIDSVEEKNLLKLALSEFDEDEVMRLSQSFTGLDAKNAATFTLEIMKRIDFLFNKMPYVNDGFDNNDPAGLF